ncbi:hypothetical protein A1OO_13545 [Enterovibrio norvegicus FF-33]|uniref:Nucleoside recognition protein n=1 Tax=Enterovibrio norvegicus FF-454 TaxID=1185651 RepID=A0A1E5CBH9_9GAMM|nr:hypothetical protein [Enterovibrio norvegicus]OEE62861.1 hypothetical protein A1OK_19965 [Enterovibrio norvegicus FF-454]OEE66785.1 hypothetical protein A1OO_13545 [Enterovibrio norvegicus FF-33]OEE76578.1 hypothetical protein A1OQ_06145 [Enterovibrio norvegicus FF-162]
MSGIKEFLSRTFKDSVNVATTLYKVMIPTIIFVKIFEEMGGVEWFSDFIAPLMQLVGLPSEMGLVWATAMFINIYSSLVILVNLDVPMTVAQASILSCMILLAHSMPIEVSLAKKSGVSVWWAIVSRVGGALLFAWILQLIYSTTGSLQDPAQIIWQTSVSGDIPLTDWALNQVQNLGIVFVIILALILMLNLLKVLGIERLIAKALSPFLRLLGISQEATNLTLIGITLGLSYGGGLLVNEARKGHIPPRDVFTAITLLGLLHSLIEDTILMLVIGADFNTIFWGRLIFVLVIVGTISRLIRLVDGKRYERLFYRSVAI